jgi:DHA2 family integral membrane protein (MFS transporter)
VATLGSVLAESYRSSMSPKLGLLPEPLRSAAANSITATQAIAERLGAAGRSLLTPANTAYVDAMHIATLTATGIAVLGALVMLRWMPGKPKADEVIAEANADAGLAAKARA